MYIALWEIFKKQLLQDCWLERFCFSAQCGTGPSICLCLWDPLIVGFLATGFFVANPNSVQHI